MEVKIEGLTKVYGRKVQALDGVDLEMPTGMFGLLGPNGAGKTTLMRILAGILNPTSGTVRVGDHDMATEAGRTAVKRVLGYLPQDLGLYPDLSAHEFLDYVGILKGLEDRKARRLRVGELLEMVGLSDVAKRKLKGFSGGMKRRVGIAQALLNDPRLLIVDEPTAGLDPEERIRFRNLLSDLAGERTVLLSTHIVEDVAQTSRDLAVMASGRVVFRGAPPRNSSRPRRAGCGRSRPTGARPKATSPSSRRCTSAAQCATGWSAGRPRTCGRHRPSRAWRTAMCG